MVRAAIGIDRTGAGGTPAEYRRSAGAAAADAGAAHAARGRAASGSVRQAQAAGASIVACVGPRTSVVTGPGVVCSRLAPAAVARGKGVPNYQRSKEGQGRLLHSSSPDNFPGSAGHFELEHSAVAQVARPIRQTFVQNPSVCGSIGKRATGTDALERATERASIGNADQVPRCCPAANRALRCAITRLHSRRERASQMRQGIAVVADGGSF